MAKGEIFGQLPTWAKGVIAVAVVGGAAFLGYQLYTEVKKAGNKKDAKAELDATNDELAELNKVPAKKQTITAAQAKTSAGVIHAAMDGYGTNTPVIGKQLMQLKNQADWLALSSAYGVRTLSSGKLNPEPDFVGGLLPALTNEIGASDAIYTAQINGLLKQRGINLTL